MIKLVRKALGKSEIVRTKSGKSRRQRPMSRWRMIARKVVRTPGGTVMGFVLSSAQNVAQIAPAVATRWNVTVYQQRKRRLGGSLYWDRVNDFDGATAEEATRKAQEYVRSKGWQLAAGGGATS